LRDFRIISRPNESSFGESIVLGRFFGNLSGLGLGILGTLKGNLRRFTFSANFLRSSSAFLVMSDIPIETSCLFSGANFPSSRLNRAWPPVCPYGARPHPPPEDGRHSLKGKPEAGKTSYRNCVEIQAAKEKIVILNIIIPAWAGLAK
jgi:hypothetical protein